MCKTFLKKKKTSSTRLSKTADAVMKYGVQFKFRHTFAYDLLVETVSKYWFSFKHETGLVLGGGEVLMWPVVAQSLVRILY